MEADYQSALRIIREKNRFLIGCHRTPDADSLGSALGLARLLESLGKSVSICVPDGVPASLRFLPGTSEVQEAIAEGELFDACFLMDLATKKLLLPSFPLQNVGGPVIIVDHHAMHDSFGDIKVRDVSAPATGAVVLKLARMLSCEITSTHAATPLYAALLSDTGGFRHSNTSAQTFRDAAYLVEAGVDPAEVSFQTFAKWPQERIPLLQAALAQLQFELEGRLALLVLERSLLDKLGVADALLEGLVDYGRSVEGVEISAFLWEQRLDDFNIIQTRISLRSRRDANVARVAQQLGGGGHILASGATVAARAPEVRVQLIDLAQKELVSSKILPG